MQCSKIPAMLEKKMDTRLHLNGYSSVLEIVDVISMINKVIDNCGCKWELNYHPDPRVSNDTRWPKLCWEKSLLVHEAQLPED